MWSWTNARRHSFQQMRDDLCKVVVDVLSAGQVGEARAVFVPSLTMLSEVREGGSRDWEIHVELLRICFNSLGDSEEVFLCFQHFAFFQMLETPKKLHAEALSVTQEPAVRGVVKGADTIFDLHGFICMQTAQALLAK